MKMSSSNIEIYGNPESHSESKLCQQNRQATCSYIKTELHQLRLDILADLIKKIAAHQNKKIYLLNLGCGEGALELRLNKIKNLYRIGLDVCLPFLEKGMKNNLFDRAIAADMTLTLPIIKFPTPIDIVVVAETLEHLLCPAVFIKEKINPLQEKTGYFVGSVPNMAQLFDVIGLMTGIGCSYQTSRPLLDPTARHVSFFSIKSLEKALLFADYGKIKIVGNAVRLFRNGNKSSRLLAQFPFFKNFSDRLIFSCQKK